MPTIYKNEKNYSSGVQIDDSLSTTSKNPVQNKVVKSALDNKADTNSLGTAATKDVATTGDASTTQVVMGNDSRLSDSRPASDVSAWAKASTKPTYTASEVGAIATTEKGTANGVAELDSNGKVPSSQLPSSSNKIKETRLKPVLKIGKRFYDSVWFGLTAFNGGNIWTDGDNIYCGGEYVLSTPTKFL